MHSNNPMGMLDVVCGKSADVGSPHRFVHGGALFCFCSDDCLARFIVDPHQFVPGKTASRPSTFRWSRRPTRAPRGIEGLAQAAGPAARKVAPPPEPVRPAADAAPTPLPVAAAVVLPVPVPVLPPIVALAPALPGGVDLGTRPRGQDIVEYGPAVRPATLKPAPLPMSARSNGGGNLLASLFAWGEKRFATRMCTDLMRLHRIVVGRQPLLRGRPLYREIVAAYNGGDYAHANAVLESAEQSFAIWPVERPLKFADVVHYLAASEFLATQKGGRWIHADMKRIVAAHVPHDL